MNTDDLQRAMDDHGDDGVHDTSKDVVPQPPPMPVASSTPLAVQRSHSSEIVSRTELDRRLRMLWKRIKQQPIVDVDDGLAGDKTVKYCLRYRRAN